MNQKQFERWRAIRQKGQLHYFLTWGVLKRALPLVLLMILYNHLRSEGLRLPDFTLMDVTSSVLAFVLSVGVIGMFWTMLSWYGAEDDFLQYQRSERQSAAKHSEGSAEGEMAKSA